MKLYLFLDLMRALEAGILAYLALTVCGRAAACMRFGSRQSGIQGDP